MKKNNKRKWILRVSILFNLVFILGWLIQSLNSPTYKLGVLTQDINVGLLAGDSIIFKMPQGTTVRNVSPRGIGAIGQFENNRFEIIITTDRNIVDYNVSKDQVFGFGNYYSADINSRKE